MDGFCNVTFFCKFFLKILINFYKVLQTSRFEGQIFLWVSGLILLTLIVLITEDFKLHLLYINTNKFENEHIALVFLHYLNVLLHDVCNIFKKY